MTGRPRSGSRAGRLVGRDPELQVISEAFRRGRASAVLITGEPGAGKTGLLEAAAAGLVADGARLLSGHALDLAEGAPRFLPLAGALAGAWRELPEPPAQAAGVLAAAGLGPPGAPVPALVALQPAAERLRLLDALAEVCLRLAGDRPLVLALDDMQWAAPEPWDAAAYLVRAAGDAPVLVLLAAGEEVLASPTSAAAAAVEELRRLRRLAVLALGRLAQRDVERLAASCLGGPVAPELARVVGRRSEGNPFFAEETLADLAERNLLVESAGVWRLRREARADLEPPALLRLTVARRLQRLPAQTQRHLAAGAVLGRDFPVATVAAMLDVIPDAVEAALAPARAASILTRPADGAYAFRHDALREAMYELAAGVRPALHAAAAAALAPGAEPADLGAIARHWLRAGDRGRAAASARAAAELARGRTSAADALAHARLARELAEAIGGPGAPELLAARRLHGEAAEAAGESIEAESALRAALDAAQAAPERGELHLLLGRVLRRREAAEEASAQLDRALALAPDERVTAAALVELATLNGLTRGRSEAAERQASAALETAARLADGRLEARAALALADVRVDADGVRPLLERALERAQAAGDLAAAIEACAALSSSYYRTGELAASERAARRRLALAERGGDLLGLRQAQSWLALLACSRGDWDDARRLLGGAEAALLRLATPGPLAFVRVVQGLVHWRVGELEAAADRLGEALSLTAETDPAAQVRYAGLPVLANVELGREADARAGLAAQEERVAALPDAALPARSARTVLGLVYAGLGDREAGRRCEDALRPHAGDFHWWPAARTLAALATLRGDRETALADLAAAERLCRREHLRPDLALVQRARSALGPGRRAAPRAASRRAARGSSRRGPVDIGRSRPSER